MPHNFMGVKESYHSIKKYNETALFPFLVCVFYSLIACYTLPGNNCTVCVVFFIIVPQGLGNLG